jgi:hypothetical protein
VRFLGLWFKSWGLGFEVEGLGLGVEGWRCEVLGSWV